MDRVKTASRFEADVDSETLAGPSNEAQIHPASGTHLLLTLKGCRSALINDADGLKALAERAAVASGATVLQIVAHRFQPQGTTVVAVLAESHASLHTYPELSTVFWDCFTCGTSCQPELSEAVLTEALLPAVVNKQVIRRD